MAPQESGAKDRPIRRLLQRIAARKELKQDKNERVPAPAPADSKTLSPAAPKRARNKDLWDEVYDSVTKRSDSKELHGLARRLRQDIDTSNLNHGDPARNGVDASREWQVCNEVLRLATEKQLQVRDDRQNSLVGSTAQAYANIATWAQKFVQIGDVVAQVDPVHVGLPWAGIRLILLFSVYDHQSDVAVLEGVAHMSKLIYRYAVFEDVYLRNRHPLPATLIAQLVAAVKDLYAVVLLYLLKVQQYFERGVRPRLTNIITLSDSLAQLAKEVEAKEIEVHNYERIAIKSASYQQFLEVRKILGAYDDHLQAREREEILDWISTLPYHAYHRNVYDRVLAGTGQWFLERHEFRRWSQSDRSSLLWLRGDAGTGKSSLIAGAIDRFLQEPQLESTEAMAYFYCSRTSGDTNRQVPVEALGSLLRQLASPIPGLPIKAPLVSKYKQEKARGSRQARFTLKESTGLITELIQHHYRRVTLVLDALDECDEKSRADLFVFLARLVRTQDVIIKVLISSRNEIDILNHFGGSANLYIDAEDNAEDIGQYVDTEIDKRLLHGRAGSEIRSQVKGELKHKAQGIFRWAHLQVETLCDPEYVHGEDDISELLRTIPQTLEATYTETLAKFQRYPTASREAILNAVRLLLCAEHPMTTDEVLGAVTILSETGRATFDEHDLIRMSRSLIVEDEQFKQLRFTHLSVREFLEAQRGFTESAHAAAAEACLKVFIDRKSPDIDRQAETRERETRVIESAKWAFHAYAVERLGRHCKKSGAYKQDHRLRYLLSYFMVEEEGRNSFNRWNRGSYQLALVVDASDPFFERRNCRSRPAQPLFMACVYGFDDLAEQLVSHDNSALDAENCSTSNPLEVAAIFGNHSILRMLYKVAAEARESSVRPERLAVAAAWGAPAILSFLLDQRPEIASYPILLATAAGNKRCGEEMVRLVLRKGGHVAETGLELVFERVVSVEIVNMLMSHLGTFDITNSMLHAAVNNYHINRELVQILLSRYPAITISEDCVISAAVGGQYADGAELVKVLLAHPKCCPITEEVLHIIVSRGDARSVRSLQLLLERLKDFAVTEDLLAAAAGNSIGGPAILHFLLESATRPNITQQVLQSAMQNSLEAKNIMKILRIHPCCPDLADETICTMTARRPQLGGVYRSVARLSREPHITEVLMQDVARHGESTDMAYLLSSPRAYPISEATIAAAASNFFDNVHMTRLLLTHAPHVRFKLTEDTLILLMDRARALEPVERIAKKYGPLPVTEAVMKAAVHHHSQAKSFMDFLLPGSSGSGYITRGVLEAAVESENVDVVQSIFRHQRKVDLTESVLESAIKRRGSSGVMKLLLTYPGRPPISESLLKRAASDGNLSLVELLLSQPDAPRPSAEILVKAASNDLHGATVLRYLMSLQEWLVPKDAFIAAAGNRFSGPEVMRLLLAQWDSTLPMNESVLHAAATNGPCGKKLLQILFSLPYKAEVTVETIRAAVSKDVKSDDSFDLPGLGVLRVLLAHCTRPIPDPERLIETAAERRDGKWMVQLLLSHFGDIPITPDALKAAAGNEDAGTSIMKVFLSRPGISASRDVFRAAAGNQRQGTEMVRLLLEQFSGSLGPTEELLVAALGNPLCGRSLLKLLLVQTPDFTITTAIIDAASNNKTWATSLLLRLLKEAITKGDDQAKYKVLQRLKEGTYGSQDVLFMTIYEGDEQVLKLLLEHGADVTAQVGELGTALDIAVHAADLRMVELVIDYGANIHSRSSFRGGALEAACDHGYCEIARCLIAHGADINQTDSMGRTLLHRALRQDECVIVDCLLLSGVSLTAIDHQGLSSMHHAACADSDQGIQRLLGRGVSLGGEDSYGWSPLHWAAWSGNEAAAASLLEAGASRPQTDRDGRTASNIAALCGHGDLEALLWAADASEPPPQTRLAPHDSYLCDACDVQIYGPRHHCNDCLDFDLCFRCVIDLPKIHDPSHDFEEFTKPRYQVAKG